MPFPVLKVVNHPSEKTSGCISFINSLDFVCNNQHLTFRPFLWDSQYWLCSSSSMSGQKVFSSVFCTCCHTRGKTEFLFPVGSSSTFPSSHGIHSATLHPLCRCYLHRSHCIQVHHSLHQARQICCSVRQVHPIRCFQVLH